MRITVEQPPAPPVEYVLRMDWEELHRLHHELAGLCLTGYPDREAVLCLRKLLQESAYALPTADDCDCPESGYPTP